MDPHCTRDRDVVCNAGHARAGTTLRIVDSKCTICRLCSLKIVQMQMRSLTKNGRMPTRHRQMLTFAQRLGALPKSCLQIIGLAQLESDRLRSQLCAFGLFIRVDGNVPTSLGIGMHPDIEPFFREAISDHFRQFFGRHFWFLHDLTPRLILSAPPHGSLPATAPVILPQESIFDLCVNTMEPLLCALGSVAVRRDFCF
jgi:hypothetical protein